MELNIGISDENRKNVVSRLAVLLANEFVLSLKARNAHWNVVGIDFADKHGLFEKQYNELSDIVDEVAERIRMLGFEAPASLKEYIALTTLEDVKGETKDSKSFITLLLKDHEAIIQLLRESIPLFENEYKDVGTSDYITGLMQAHEKSAWFLRAHL